MTPSLATAITPTSPGPPISPPAGRAEVGSARSRRTSGSSSAAAGTRSRLPQPSRELSQRGAKVYPAGSLPVTNLNGGSSSSYPPGLLDFHSITSRPPRAPTSVPRRASQVSATGAGKAPSVHPGLSTSTSLGSLDSLSSLDNRRSSRINPQPPRSYLPGHPQPGGGLPPILSNHQSTSRRPSATSQRSGLPQSFSDSSLSSTTRPAITSRSSRPPPSSFVTRVGSPSAQRETTKPGPSSGRRPSAEGVRRESASPGKGHRRKVTPTIVMDDKGVSSAGSSSEQVSGVSGGMAIPLLGNPIGTAEGSGTRSGSGAKGRTIPEARNRSRSPTAKTGVGAGEKREGSVERKDSGVRLMGLGIDAPDGNENLDGDRTIQADEVGYAEERTIGNRLSGLSSASAGSGTIRSPSLRNGDEEYASSVPSKPDSSATETSPKASLTVQTAALPITPQKPSRSSGTSPASSIGSFAGGPPSISPRISSIPYNHSRQNSTNSLTSDRRPSSSSIKSFASNRSFNLMPGQPPLTRIVSGLSAGHRGDPASFAVPARGASLVLEPTSRPSRPNSELRGGVKSWAESQGLAALGVGLLDPMGNLGHSKGYSRKAATSELDLTLSPRSMVEGSDIPGNRVSWGGLKNSAELTRVVSSGRTSPAGGARVIVAKHIDRPASIEVVDTSVPPTLLRRQPVIAQIGSTNVVGETFTTDPTTPSVTPMITPNANLGAKAIPAATSGPSRPAPTQYFSDQRMGVRPGNISRISSETVSSPISVVSGRPSPPVPARNPLRQRQSTGLSSSRASPLPSPAATSDTDLQHLADVIMNSPRGQVGHSSAAPGSLTPQSLSPQSKLGAESSQATLSDRNLITGDLAGQSERSRDRSIRPSASESLISELPTRAPSFSPAGNRSPGRMPGRNARLTLSVQDSPQLVDFGSRRSTLVHSRSYSQPDSPSKFNGSVSSNGSTDTPTLAAPSSSPHSSRLTKRAHLINEICSTERAYAKDLALVRDAYVHRLRPSSQHSTVSTSLTSDQFSPGSRTSTSTVDTAATSQTSFFQDLGGKPGGVPGDRGAGSFYVSSRPPSLIGGNLTSHSSLNSISGGNVMGRARSSSKSGTAPPASDIKAIFVNIEQIAGFAEDLASAFERAAGDGTGREPVMNDQSERVAIDALGKIFLEATSSMTALYTTYCAKQSQANDRLLDLQKNPMYASYFRDCWAIVQPHTNAWDLGSMLIKPVQRVLKYPLLFGDLLANTSPVHPDYFNLRKAAASARDIGDEINEVKRRKDVVEKALANNKGMKSWGGTVADNGVRKSSGPNLGFGFGKKLRDKIKDRSQTASPASPPGYRLLDATAEADLKTLISRLTEADGLVRRIGQEVNNLPDHVQQVWVSQYSLVETWVKLAALQPSDLAGQAGERMEMYRLLVAEILAEPIQKLDQEIRDSILPAFSTLLQLGINPRALVGRLHTQRSNYERVKAASRKRSEEKNLAASIRESAQEYVALHDQLLEELPSLLIGHRRILNLTLLAHARAQADFHQAVRARHRAFVLAVSGEDPPEGVDYDVLQATVEVMDGRAMVKNWHKAWKPFNEVMEGLAISRGPGTARDGRSHVTSPVESLSRTNSSKSKLGNSRPESLRPSSSGPRLQVPEHGRTPSSEDLTGGLERKGSNSRGGQLGRLRSSSLVQSLTPTANGGRPPLPTTDPPTNLPTLSDFGPSGNGDSLEGRRLGRPFSYLPPLKTTDAIVMPDLQPSSSPGGLPHSVLSWEDEESLYQCVCVAKFRLDIEIWYAGLRFLSIDEGNVIDILHEVGRVDNLIDLPIDVGVADDGLLVGRASSGDVGLVLCSFLTPVQDHA